ncbi:class I SAM-dependent methyltransferase [Planktothrix agardhii]|jgi:SAM-dependent methyltransferase|uniref:class I SAM-dependent methyltransferase n=1 Tax=Planktothrix agardhii TaxID=1160 RepID=UPI0020A82B5D|nr:class I SAM-dependent methyltransferase [Planktothrix agardhii]CAD5946440.1 hypothetical protein NO365_02265 [Planktothrix agardhii]
MNKAKHLTPKILTKISPNDNMCDRSAETGLSNYFGVGMSAVHVICNVLDEINLKPRYILDMPCGYGRVIRFLRVVFPSAEIYACELNKEAVDFCSSVFNTHGVYSNENFTEVDFPEKIKFDLIWVGSLITHLPQNKTIEFIQFALGKLSQDGIIMITSHGKVIHDLMGEERKFGLNNKQIESVKFDYSNSGYGYGDYLHLPNLVNYGVSLINHKWWIHTASHLGFDLNFIESGWCSHDVVVIGKV